MKRCDAEYSSRLSIRITSRNSMYKSNILSNEYIVSIIKANSRLDARRERVTKPVLSQFSILIANTESRGRARQVHPTESPKRFP